MINVITALTVSIEDADLAVICGTAAVISSVARLNARSSRVFGAARVVEVEKRAREVSAIGIGVSWLWWWCGVFLCLSLTGRRSGGE